MPSRKLSDAHPRLVKSFEYAKKQFESQFPGLQVILTCTYRSPEEQEKLFNQPFDGIDNDGDGKIDEKDEKVTNAKKGQSKHNAYPSLAIDVAFRKTDGSGLEWRLNFFKIFYHYMLEIDTGIRWGALKKYGGHFTNLNDGPHYEI